MEEAQSPGRELLVPTELEPFTLCRKGQERQHPNSSLLRPSNCSLVSPVGQPTRSRNVRGVHLDAAIKVSLGGAQGCKRRMSSSKAVNQLWGLGWTIKAAGSIWGFL